MRSRRELADLAGRGLRDPRQGSRAAIAVLMTVSTRSAEGEGSTDMSGVRTESCHSCGAIVPVSDGPTHRYLESSPGCWEVYGKILAKEFSRRRYFEVHPLTADSYALQHPGSPSPQTIRSAALHLLSLHAALERDLPMAMLASVKQKAKRLLRDQLVWLDPPENLGAVTVAEVARATNAADHQAWVRRWARSAWEAWAAHHDTVHGWAVRL